VAVLNPRRETAVYARVLDSSSESRLTIRLRDGDYAVFAHRI